LDVNVNAPPKSLYSFFFAGIVSHRRMPVFRERLMGEKSDQFYGYALTGDKRENLRSLCSKTSKAEICHLYLFSFPFVDRKSRSPDEFKRLLPSSHQLFIANHFSRP